MNYTIDFDKLISYLLPGFMRKVRQQDWLRSLIKPLKTRNEDFINFVDDVNYHLSWNGQTISLTHLLIDRFGAGFVIVNTNQSVRPLHLFTNSDRRNLEVFNLNHLKNPVIYEANRFDASDVHFIVKVPGHVSLTGEHSKEREIKALVNRYKLYSKRFKVEHV